MVPEVDGKAKELYNTDPQQARDYLSDFSVSMGNGTVQRWKNLFEYLVVKYIDGNIKKEENGKFLDNGTGQAVGPLQPGYPEWFKAIIVEKTGDKLKVTEEPKH